MQVWAVLIFQQIPFTAHYVEYVRDVSVFETCACLHHFTVICVLFFFFYLLFYFFRMGKHPFRASCDYIYNASLSSVCMLAILIEFSACYHIRDIQVNDRCMRRPSFTVVCVCFWHGVAFINSVGFVLVYVKLN